MRTWTATTTEHVLDVLCAPEAAARRAPVPFDVDVEVHTAGAAGLSLAARGALETTVSRIAREAKGLS